jgi:hypothetical protein
MNADNAPVFNLRSSALLTIRFLLFCDEFHHAAVGIRRLTVALEAAITAVATWRPLGVT